MPQSLARRWIPGVAVFAAGSIVGVGVLAGLLAATGINGLPARALRHFGIIDHVQANPAADWLEKKYGPDKQSASLEEWIIRDFFRDRRDGTFLDVGANDYKDASNTWYLETRLGWSGIAVDAQREFEAGYREHRPRTRFRTFFVADKSNMLATLYLNGSPDVASSDRAFTAQFGPVTATREVGTITLDDLLDAEGISHVDLMTMDIELGEPKALAGFDVRRMRPSLVCIEAHQQVRQQILEYFAANQYVVAGKYLPVDQRNLYFVPAGTVLEPFPE